MKSELTFADRPLQARSFEAQVQELCFDGTVSPLEPMFGRALLNAILDPEVFGPPRFCNLFLPCGEVANVGEMPPQTRQGFVIAYQVGCGKYLLDFLIHAQGRRLVRADVETDGISYHGDEEQYGLDRQRDIYVQEQGLRVLRYTGAQIREDADKYARQALAALWKMAGGG